MLECRSKALTLPRSLRLFRKAMRTCDPARTAVWRTESGLCVVGDTPGGERGGGGEGQGGREGRCAPLADLMFLEGPDLGLVHLGLVGDGERGAVSREGGGGKGGDGR